MGNTAIKYRDDLQYLSPYIPGRPMEDVQKEYGLKEVVKLASNENPYGSSPKVKEAVIKSLDAPSYYPDGNCTKLKEALAQKYGVFTGEIILGCGTDEVISMLGKTFINKGDECITAETTFSQYAAAVTSMGGKMIYAKMKDYSFDLDAIAGAVTDRTKMIFLANPNNPTGTIYSGREQAEFIKKIPGHILIAVDEAYSEFMIGQDFPDTLSMMKAHKNVVLLKTFSKAYGLASFRVGYAIGDEAIISLMERVRNPFNVSVQAQAAALAALSDQDFVRETAQKNKEAADFFCAQLDQLKIRYIPTNTNFIMVDTGRDSMEMFTSLQKLGYITRPGKAFQMDTYLRVSIGAKDDMEGFTAALKKVLGL